ncbi:uncharacterized protein [Cicer arietinum]|uniref:uncharacterized protein n=1 Tax=Cicer arietinum TaxID=3827 RepID=UPI0006417689
MALLARQLDPLHQSKNAGLLGVGESFKYQPGSCFSSPYLELHSEPLVGLGDGGASTDKAKRMIFWVVQVKNVEGEIKERPIRIRDADPLPIGGIVLIPFDGPRPIY